MKHKDSSLSLKECLLSKTKKLIDHYLDSSSEEEREKLLNEDNGLLVDYKIDKFSEDGLYKHSETHKLSLNPNIRAQLCNLKHIEEKKKVLSYKADTIPPQTLEMPSIEIMRQLDRYPEEKKKIFSYFEYKEFPCSECIIDESEQYWWLSQFIGGYEITYASSREGLINFPLDISDLPLSGGADVVFTQHNDPIKKLVFHGEGYTIVRHLKAFSRVREDVLSWFDNKKNILYYPDPETPGLRIKDLTYRDLQAIKKKYPEFVRSYDTKHSWNGQKVPDKLMELIKHHR